MGFLDECSFCSLAPAPTTEGSFDLPHPNHILRMLLQYIYIYIDLLVPWIPPFRLKENTRTQPNLKCGTTPITQGHPELLATHELMRIPLGAFTKYPPREQSTTQACSQQASPYQERQTRCPSPAVHPVAYQYSGHVINIYIQSHTKFSGQGALARFPPVWRWRGSDACTGESSMWCHAGFCGSFL